MRNKFVFLQKKTSFFFGLLMGILLLKCMYYLRIELKQKCRVKGKSIGESNNRFSQILS